VGVGVISRAANTTDLSPTAAGASGDKFPAGADVWLFLENSTGSAITVTIDTPGTVRGQAIADLAITVPANGYAVRGPFPADVFGDAGGLLSMTYSTNVGLSFGAWKVGA
jgi:hypothetical protein